MPTFVACPGCGIKLGVPDTLLGKKVRCASCANVFEAHADAPPPIPTPAPAAVSNGVANDLPEAPLDEPPPRQRPRDSYDYYPDYREEDDYYDEERDRYRRRRDYCRRDLEPHRGSMVLSFGILSLVLPFTCGMIGALVGVVLGPLAWIFATQDLARMREGKIDPDGEGNTRGGQICGIVGTAISALLFLLCGAYFVLVILVETMR